MSSSTVAQNRARLPGPRSVPVIGWQLQGLNMLRDPPAHFMSAFQRYGAISAWNPGKPRHVLAFGPEASRQLFSEADTFIVDAFRESKIPPNTAMSRLSFGLLRINGETHRRHRALMQPAFRARQVETYWETIVKIAQAELDTWRVGEQRRLDQDLLRLITFIAMKTMFGMDPATEGEQLQRLIKRLLAVAASPLTLLLRFDIPGTPYGAMMRVADQIEQIVRSLIHRKRENPNGQRDALTDLLAARDEEGKGLTEDELLGQAYNVLCHSGSAASLTWTLLLLDQHPEILKALVDELQSTLHGAPPTVEQLEKLELLEAVVKESLRLFPPAPFLLRYTSEECQLGPYELPKDATVFTSAYVSHRLPESFTHPLRFDPSRWESANPPVYVYHPYGAGPHNCLGRHVAQMEMKVILAMLLQRFRPALVPGTRIDRGLHISLVPKQGLPMVLHPVGQAVERKPLTGNIRDHLELV